MTVEEIKHELRQALAAVGDLARAMANQLEAAAREIERLTSERNLGDRMLAEAAPEHARMRAELERVHRLLDTGPHHKDAQLLELQAERDQLRADVERLTVDRDSIASCARTGINDLRNERDRLRAEVERMRPVVETAVRVVELDEICDAHPGFNDEIGQRAESELYAATAARTAAVDAYRAARDKAGE